MKFEIRNKRITCTDENLVGDNKGYIAEFTFDSEWNGLAQIARFVRDGQYEDMVIKSDGTCRIPFWLLKRGYIQVGCYTNGMTTTNCDVYITNSVKESTGEHADPSDTLFDQLLDEMSDTIQKTAESASQASTAASNAEQSEQNAENALAEISGHVECAKNDIDSYVKGKEADLKGDTGDVSFASFKVVPPELIMYNDKDKTHIDFTREGSKLFYQLFFPERISE